MKNRNSMPEANKANNKQMGKMPLTENNMTCNLVYPEVYYKVQPFIVSVCDQMNLHDHMISPKAFDQAGDTVYNNVCIMYPHLGGYANSQEMEESVEAMSPVYPPGRRFYPDGRHFRRRGIFRDLIDILLLQELLGRGRRFF